MLELLPWSRGRLASGCPDKVEELEAELEPSMLEGR